MGRLFSSGPSRPIGWSLTRAEEKEREKLSRGEGERTNILSGIKKPESPGAADFKIVCCSLYVNENKTKRDLPPHTLFN